MVKKEDAQTEVSLGTLYDLNKGVIQQQPDLTAEQITEKRTLVENFIRETKNKYYMLLCNDRRDFTVFTLLDGEDKSAKAAFEMVDECLIPRGIIKDIDKTVDGYAIEIWLSIDDEIYCYYFFPYDNAIVEV